MTTATLGKKNGQFAYVQTWILCVQIQRKGTNRSLFLIHQFFVLFSNEKTPSFTQTRIC